MEIARVTSSYGGLLPLQEFIMKHKLFLLLTLTLAHLFPSAAQEAVEQDIVFDEVVSHGKGGSVILPGNGHIDLESLLTRIDTRMDISQLSLSELRVLRNAFAARQGYCFMSADLRSIFNQTSWYDSLMYVRWENEEQRTAKPIAFTQQESAFIERLKAREAELQKSNFAPPTAGWRVNTANLVNPFQLTTIDPRLDEALGRNGFAIVPNTYKQLFHVYEKNDYHDFPSFVTTDLFLQLFHLYFDCLLRQTEQYKLDSVLTRFIDGCYDSAARRSGDEAAYLKTYFAIARALHNGSEITGEANGHHAMAAHEVQHARSAENDVSDFLGYHDAPFAYSLFRPRGHYTRNDTLSRYFQTMMWLQTVPFATDNVRLLACAVELAYLVGGTPQLAQLYQQLTEPMTFLLGQPDNISILQVYDLVRESGASLSRRKSKKMLAQLRQSIEALAAQQQRIRPRYEYTSRYKVNLMPQRYMPDAEVLQELVDYDGQPTRRDAPKGLDVMAAMGCTAAERILVDELGERTRWEGYMPALERMKQRMDSIDWQQTVANRWMHSLRTLVDEGRRTDGPADGSLPYFMLTPQWDKKQLNAALASWAELKHDAILYAKQPMGAECGDGGPPAPTVVGYVEPNVGYWQQAVSLLDATEQVLSRHGLLTERAADLTLRLREEAEFLLGVSRKELEGRRLTNEEYDQIEIIGATFENISLDLIREPDQWLMWWDDVQGTDKHVALVADVYTANADNNPPSQRSVLYEAVGPASEIYVVVQIGGYLYLTRGAVLSYREFQRPLSDPRMTDEEWQQKLQGQPRYGTPQWMDEITVPLDGNEPDDNEEVFYSSGC